MPIARNEWQLAADEGEIAERETRAAVKLF